MLFLVNSNHGFSNVHLAVAYTFLEKYHSVRLPFKKLRERVERVGRAGVGESPSAHTVSLHQPPGDGSSPPQRQDGLGAAENMILPLGLEGIRYQTENLWCPATQRNHPARKIINEVDLALLVMERMIKSATDAVRDAERLYVGLSLSTLEHFAARKSWEK